ncbi:hypothetical protein STIAU_1327, partial [Stigmatella aurantiaca DW4/3-1]
MSRRGQRGEEPIDRVGLGVYYLWGE